MRIHHIALWTPDLDGSRIFIYALPGPRGEKYENPLKGMPPIFCISMTAPASRSCSARISLPRRWTRSSRLSVMPTFPWPSARTRRWTGWQQTLVAEGYPLVDGPRRTGDGYYEAVILDPDGNRLELNAAA